MSTYSVKVFIQHKRGLFVLPMTPDEHKTYLINVQSKFLQCYCNVNSYNYAKLDDFITTVDYFTLICITHLLCRQTRPLLLMGGFGGTSLLRQL